MANLQDQSPPVSTPGSSSSTTGSVVSTIGSSVSSISDICVPEHWRLEVEQCIEEKFLTESARNEIVRTLVNVLFTKYRKPPKDALESIARKLIIVHPFMKDDLGNGYVRVCMHACSPLFGLCKWVHAACSFTIVWPLYISGVLMHGGIQHYNLISITIIMLTI